MRLKCLQTHRSLFGQLFYGSLFDPSFSWVKHFYATNTRGVVQCNSNPHVKDIIWCSVKFSQGTFHLTEKQNEQKGVKMDQMCVKHVIPTNVGIFCCLLTLALLIVYGIFSKQACDMPLPTKLYKLVTNNTTFQKGSLFPSSCLQRKLRDLMWTFDMLAEHSLSLCSPSNSIIYHNGDSAELGGGHGWKQMGWKCFSTGPPKKLTK